ncbi:D-TA family PLP-dependent enzyme [Pseudonocardia xinjiangensis]|uniref:D-TA family PLP-dependent enzyme n=1 Tax=Pseudonocardia xinjiangensis TaxID=75289 RepID=A0ABX1RAW9_9PSEU|nr:alanine racemase [Pseudonocardia xinjiangensis]NMH76579.1 D-TA family PLP-dependent enzyme [Pseudonocardia xinjiangensis]
MTATGLIGDGLDTPFLAVDVDALDRNLTRMAGVAQTRGLALRPHVKTHKCPEIARRQVGHGAAGLTVATVGEAEIFAASGFADLFIAYPIWAAGARAARLRAVAEQASLRVGVDSAEAAQVLARAVAGTDVEAVVEIDSGHHRSGVQPGRAAEVATAAARAGLRVSGVFTFPGHSYGPGRREQAAADEAAALAGAAATLRKAGLDVEVVSGGSTPSAAIADGVALTEIRPGVYVFNDAQQAELGSCSWSDIALTAVSTVVSGAGRRVVLDAGSKVLGADQPAWATGGGRLPDHPGARIVALSEHHATVVLPEDGGVLQRGDVVRVAPNHVCSAVNLADELVVLAQGIPVDRWPVAARNANT